MKQIIVNSENLQTRIALVVDGRIEEYYIEREGTQRIVGSIYKGRIRNLEPSLQAAFVDIGFEKNAFLHYWDMIPATRDLLEFADDDDDANDNADKKNEQEQADKKQSGRSHNRRKRSRNGQNERDPDGDEKQDNRKDNSAANDRRNDPKPAHKKTADAARPSEVETASADPGSKTGFSTTIKKFLTGRFFASREEEAQAGGGSVAAPPEQAQSADADRNDRSGSNRNSRHRRDNKRGRRNDNRQKQRPDQDDRKKDSKDQNQRFGRNNKRRSRRPRREFDLDEIPKKFAVGSDVVVQVSKGMIGDKGPRVTTNLSLPGRYVVLLPNSSHRGVSRRIENRNERGRLRQMIQKADLPKNMGLICRTAAEGISEAELTSDIAYLVEKWEMAERLRRRRSPVCIYQEPNLLERCLRDFLGEHVDEIIVDVERDYKAVLRHLKYIDKERRPRVRQYNKATPLFEAYKISEQISNLFRRKITLPSGAEVCFDETEALIAVDVNSGKSRGGKDHPETILNTNLEAADEIGRQLRIRNVGGLVVIDFIDMRSRKDQQKVYRKMREILSRDRAKSKILPLSRLGLMEMTRQREHASLQKAVYEACHYCGGRGLVKSSTTISVELQRRLQEVMRRSQNQRMPIRVTVHPRVLQRLKHEDADILDAMEREHGGELTFRADEAVHQEEFHVINTETGKEL